MSKYHSKWIALMYWKDKELKKAGCEINYFNKTDEDNIKKLPDEFIKNSWEQLVLIIRQDDIWYFSDSRLCIFCIYFKDIADFGYCPACSYGNEHGICMNYNSSYKKIIRFFKNEHIDSITDFIGGEKIKSKILKINRNIL